MRFIGIVCLGLAMQMDKSHDAILTQQGYERDPIRSER
jgi:hypothetical protein